MRAKLTARIIWIAVILAVAAMACVGGGGGRSWTPPTRTAYAEEALGATAWSAQRTAMAAEP